MEIMPLRIIKSELSLHLFEGGVREFCLHSEKLFNDQQRVFFVHRSGIKRTAVKLSWLGITGWSASMSGISGSFQKLF